MYRIIRSILFLLPAETAHYFSMNIFKALCFVPFIKKISSKFFAPPLVETNVFGLTFKNPIGLGAGFDKNAKYLGVLETLGFGFIEIGTVTPLPQAGNERPRLFRLPKDKALVNRMGFNNDGVEVVVKRLKKWRTKENRQPASGIRQLKNISDSQFIIQHSPIIIGGNIGKNKNTPNEDAWKDYDICFNALHEYVDFFVVNVSSPNTPGLRELQEKDALKKILSHLQLLNSQKENLKPILLKIAPDLTQNQIDDVIELAKEIKLDGIVATNTTITREKLHAKKNKLETIGVGGLSGKPLQQRSNEIIRYIHQKSRGSIPIIGSGGVFNASDTKEKLNAGASLIEVWTGFIYEGPFIVKKILKSF